MNIVVEARGRPRYPRGMCNAYSQKVEIEALLQGFDETPVRIRLPEGIPNLEPREDVRITDSAPIVRATECEEEAGVADLVQRRWSWPGPNGKPVYNFRSEGREFAGGRCLILADGFYEFTRHSDPKAKRKHKWLFTMKDRPWFCIAGIWRGVPDLGEAFTMLTVEPGPDVAPYHSRQIVVLPPRDWSRWLDPRVPAGDVLRSLPAGSLEVEQVN